LLAFEGVVGDLFVVWGEIVVPISTPSSGALETGDLGAAMIAVGNIIQFNTNAVILSKCSIE
jgi:hypothetical protein